MGKGHIYRPYNKRKYEQNYESIFNGKDNVKNCTTCAVLVPNVRCYNCNEHTGWKGWADEYLNLNMADDINIAESN